MPATTNVWTVLSGEIKNVLVTVEQDGATAFADVEEYPTTNFTGMPAATIIPSDSMSDYATIVQNLRTYVFNVDLYYPLEAQGTGYQQAFSDMRTLVDTTLNAFDNSNDLNNACDMLRPTPAAWSVVETGDGTFLNALITLQCAVTISTDNG